MNRPGASDRRADALSKARIVEAAIGILDAEGEGALTFRTLASRLATGSGAIYWHVSGKDELLAAAADDVVARAMRDGIRSAAPLEAIRDVAAGLFDAIDAHPWVGTQLARAPGQLAMLRVFEAIGGRLEALGVPEPAQFDAASVLVNYVLGVAGQNAANARMHAPTADRAAILGGIAARWAQLDQTAYPFLRRVAAQLPVHDDRAQFLVGIDLILAGVLAAAG